MTCRPSLRAIMLAALLASPLALVVGCSSGVESRRYEVEVRNENDRPVTVWLTKDGPPDEDGWRSPEQLATAMKSDEQIAGVVVPAGRSGDTVKQGEFGPDTRAVLRVYEGQLKFNEILATAGGGSLRKDVTLLPGRNVVVIRKAATLDVELKH